MQLFINGVSQDLAPSATHMDVEAVHRTETDLSSLHRIELAENEQLFVVSTFSLRYPEEEEELSINECLKNRRLSRNSKYVCQYDRSALDCTILLQL